MVNNKRNIKYSKTIDTNNMIYATKWKIIMFFVVFLISRPIYAQKQGEWTKNDSAKLSKMLNGEASVHPPRIT